MNQNRMIGGTSVIDVIDMIKNQCKKKQGGYMLLSQNRQLIPVKLLHPLKRKGPLLPDSTAAEKHAVRKAAAKSSSMWYIIHYILYILYYILNVIYYILYISSPGIVTCGHNV